MSFVTCRSDNDREIIVGDSSPHVGMVTVFFPRCCNRFRPVVQTVVPPELANVGFSEKMVLLPNSYQVNSYNVSSGFCLGGEDLLACQASIRQARVTNCFGQVVLPTLRGHYGSRPFRLRVS